MGLAKQAEEVARAAHVGQVDKAGKPYITHPARVAGRVRGNAELEAVAWLHDVVEDTPITLSDLLDAGFPERVVVAVDAITKREDESRDAYYVRVAADELAVQVKLADIDDNSDPGRLAALEDQATRDRLAAKYAYARAALTELPEGHRHPRPNARHRALPERTRTSNAPVTGLHRGG